LAPAVTLSCALYRTATRLELREGYDHGDLVRTQHVASEVEAVTLASQLKAAAMAVGSFVDLEGAS
jgi:hypothetical protein